MHGVASREDEPTADEVLMFERFRAPFEVWEKATDGYTPQQYTSSAKESFKKLVKWSEAYFQTEVQEATKLAADPAAFAATLATFIDEHLLCVRTVCMQPKWLPGGDAGVAGGAVDVAAGAGGAANAPPPLAPAPLPLHPRVDPEIALQQARAVVWDETLLAVQGNPALTAALQRLRATEQLRQPPAVAAAPVAPPVAAAPVPAVSGGNHTHKYVEASARPVFLLV